MQTMRSAVRCENAPAAAGFGDPVFAGKRRSNDVGQNWPNQKPGFGKKLVAFNQSKPAALALRIVIGVRVRTSDPHQPSKFALEG